jgi:hypothetical protein
LLHLACDRSDVDKPTQKFELELNNCYLNFDSQFTIYSKFS